MNRRESTSFPKPADCERWARIGTLASLAMALSYLETFIPIPIPGVKLGFANIPVLIALARGDTPGAFYIGLLKVLALGLLFGNPVTMAYSAVGTLFSCAVMALLSRIPDLRIELVSICGALAHEIGQLLVAQALLGTPLVWYSAPVLLIAGCITGFVCGMLAQGAMRLLDSEEGIPPNDLHAPQGDDDVHGSASQAALTREIAPRITISARVLLVSFMAYAVVTLHATSPWLLTALGAIALIGCFLGRVSAGSITRAIAPTLLIVAITFVAQVLSTQQGAPVLTLGPVVVTAEALQQGLLMTARLIIIVIASVAVMHLATTVELVNAIDWMLAPARALGLRTEGPVYALEVALATVPSLVELARDPKRNWRDWRHALPDFIADALANRTAERP